MEQNENFSTDRQEHLRIENEILKIKLHAQYGDAFHMETNEEMPPEIENQFLKSMMAFEEEYTNAEYCTIYERIGQPNIIPLEKINANELHNALQSLLTTMKENDINLDICDGPYPDETIYRFITEELFTIKVERKAIAGMASNFIYEEFHPNHKADIIKRTHTFLRNWNSGKFNEYCTELSWHCITPDGKKQTREDIVAKMNIFFDAFRRFENDGYNIDSVNFELQAENSTALGFAEGMLRYDAVIDNGEIIRYEGPYKLYMQLEDNWWSICYFVVPGFKW